MSDDGLLLVEAHDCPMSSCAAPADSPYRTGRGMVAAQCDTARFRLVSRLAKALTVPVPPLRHADSAWTELPRPERGATAGAAIRPGLDKTVSPAREIRTSGAAVTVVAHEHKRLGRGIELTALAEQLRTDDIGAEFLEGELQGSHDPSGVVFTVLAAMAGSEREYLRDRTLEGHESARARGEGIGGAAVTDDAKLAGALHHRCQSLALRDIAARLVITTSRRKGRPPSPATVMRLLREHDTSHAAVEGTLQ